jgi:hypothetical protein
MVPHAFAVGQRVIFTPGRNDANVPRGAYIVTRLMPLEGIEQQYRVKSAGDAHERVVRESQLRRE